MEKRPDPRAFRGGVREERIGKRGREGEGKARSGWNEGNEMGGGMVGEGGAPQGLSNWDQHWLRVLMEHNNDAASVYILIGQVLWGVIVFTYWLVRCYEVWSDWLGAMRCDLIGQVLWGVMRRCVAWTEVVVIVTNMASATAAVSSPVTPSGINQSFINYVSK